MIGLVIGAGHSMKTDLMRQVKYCEVVMGGVMVLPGEI